MSLKFFLNEGLSEPNLVAISEGMGSGSKLFQSLIDSHDEVIMVPGYALMYFYPYWEKYIEDDHNLDWLNIVDRLINLFASIFNTTINPGSESMDQLGKNKDQFILIDKEKFKEIFLSIIKEEDITSRNCLIAFHYAYALANNQDISKKRLIVYHIHVFYYISKYLYKDFPNLKVIASIRDPRGNVRRRVVNGIIRPNDRKLRKSDAFLIKHKSYRQIIRCITEGLDSLSPIKLSQIMVFKHEDLVLRLESVMQNTANFLEIKYNDGLLRPTWGGLTWMTTYYNFDSKNNVANPDILSKSWIKEESKNEIYVIEGICHAVINKYYDGGLYFKQDNLISLFKLIVKCLIPTNTEKKHIVDLLKLHQYFSIISHETKNIYDLKSYSNNLYYSLKWTNDGCDYSSLKTDTLLRFINNSSTLNLSKISILYRLIFFISRIISYIFVIIFIPLNIIFKILTCYKAIFRRFRKKSYLPDAL